MGYDRRWLEEIGSQDSHARALRGLAAVLGRSRQEGLRRAAGRLFELTLPAARDFTDLRPAAFTLVALHDYLPYFSGDRAAQEISHVVGRTSARPRSNGLRRPIGRGSKTTDLRQRGVAPCLADCAARSMDRAAMVEMSLASLDWLMTRADLAGRPLRAGRQPGFLSARRRARPDSTSSRSRPRPRSRPASRPIASRANSTGGTGPPRFPMVSRAATTSAAVLYDSATGGCCDGLSPEASASTKAPSRRWPFSNRWPNFACWSGRCWPRVASMGRCCRGSFRRGRRTTICWRPASPNRDQRGFRLQV